MSQDEEKPEGTEPIDPESNDKKGGPKKGRFDGILPEVVRRALNQGAEALNNEQIRETVVAEVVRRAINVGSEVVDSTEDRIRRFGEDLPLPKETIDKLTGRLDDYKDELFRMVSQEVRDFLDHVDLVDALTKVLTSVSFEVSTEIRFVPNDKAAKGEGGPPVKPDVKASVKMKRRKSRKNKEEE
ncbi:MAG: hypothetical protein ACE366_01175 [Bradymonadia bacterium]